MPKTVLISDFDGTISKRDFFDMVIHDLLTKDDMRPWFDYVDGKITHFEALNRIFAKVGISQKEMDSFIKKIEIDENFEKTLKLCKSLKIPVYICSAGMDYYIRKRIPEYINDYNIVLVANKGEYSHLKGFKMTPLPKESPYYDADVGISKKAVVENFKKLGYFTVYAGDGRPDVEASSIADAVFARDILLKICRKNKIKTFKFDDFSDISGFIGGLYGLK